VGHLCRMVIIDTKKAFVWGADAFHGIKQHWRDVVKGGLKSLNISLNGWYNLTMDRRDWFQQ